VQDLQHFDVEWQYDKSGAWTSGDLLHCAARTPRLAVNYTPDAHNGSAEAALSRALLAPKQSLLLTLPLLF
jgi:hypothetical protein